MKINTSSIDKNDYNFYTLPNGLRVLAISDPKADKSGCALSVNVGSYDEPEQIQGLAHFLEHMLFMGTEEYPEENEYMEYLSQHNGSSNAYTSNENTVYYFDVSNSHFKEALKIFSSFFKTPLFLKDSVEREISAVHSEFLSGKCNDGWRMSRMLQICSKTDLPESRFTVGNNDTLRIDNIDQIVRDFWAESYSSDKMCLVMYSNVDKEGYQGLIDLFKEIKSSEVSKCSKDIANLEVSKCGSKGNCKDGKCGSKGNCKDGKCGSKGNCKDGKCSNNSKDNIDGIDGNSVGGKPVSIFREDLTNRIIRIKPIKDQATLVVTTVVPPEYLLIETNPYIYISHIFSKEDKDGFVKAIKDKEWGFTASIDLEMYKDYSLLKITIGLTRTGLAYTEDILEMLTAYFRDFKYSYEEYSKIKDIKNLQFFYREMDDPIDCVESLSELMQYLPIENIFDYSYTLNKWDEDLIRKIVDRISNRKDWLIFLLTKEGEFDKTDNLYDIKYKVE